MEEVRKIKELIVERKEVLEQAWEASCVQKCDEQEDDVKEGLMVRYLKNKEEDERDF